MYSLQMESLFQVLVFVSALFSYSQGIHHVFLIAGQSNSVGINSDGFTEEDTTNDRILQFSCCKDGNYLPIEECSLILAQDPLHHYCEDGYLNVETLGFGMSFAREYIKDISDDDRIVIVPAGIAGTGFFDNTWTAYNGTGFQVAINKLIKTFKILDGMNVETIFEGILWHQGEYDAGDNEEGLVAETYDYIKQDILPMVEAFRDKTLIPFTSKKLPFVCANILPVWAQAKTSRLQIWDAIPQIPNYILYSASSSSLGLLGDPLYLSKGEYIHFTGRSLRILGRKYYQSWQLAKLNGPE